MKSKSLKNIVQILSILFVITSFLHSCKPKCDRHPHDPECSGENELITTMRVIVSDSSTGSVIDTFQFKDVDGDGNPEQFDTIKLGVNSTYRVALQFLNESVSPEENITDEVWEEKEEHFISFQPHNTSISVTYLDYDANLLPLGLDTYWKTGASSSGHLRITLHHQPGSKDGTPNPGSSDVSVEYTLFLE